MLDKGLMMKRVLPPVPASIPGFRPCAKLGYTLDVHAPKYDALKDCMAQVKRDGIKGAWVKLAEGEDPRTSRDKRLAKRTYDGAVALCELLHDNDLEWGVYFYYTIARDGRKFHWDADNELRHQISMWWKLCKHMYNAHKSLPALRTVGDIEDAKRAMEASMRSAWCLWILTRTSQEVGHQALAYLNASWTKKYLIDKGGKFGDPNSDHGLRDFELWQAHYGSRGAKRSAASLAAGPKSMPIGYEHRTAWQFGSNYLTTEKVSGFDVNVCDMPRIRIPAADLRFIMDRVQ